MTLRGFFTRVQLAAVKAMNPRFDRIPRDFEFRPIRILDPGCGPKDAVKARRFFPYCWYEGINVATPPTDPRLRDAFSCYHVADLDENGFGCAPDGTFDLVFCSHTIEHLVDGIAAVEALCAKLSPGGMLYLEWPSVESATFPLRGLGLNFYDDGSHTATFTREQIAAAVRASGCVVVETGFRREVLRMALAIPLTVYHSLMIRRLVLFDWWDITGFCYTLRATKPSDVEAG